MNETLPKKIMLCAVLCITVSGCNRTADKPFLLLPSTDPGSPSDKIVETTPNVGEQERAAEVPWGFDEASYALYQSGKLSSFLPSGSEVDQCVSADLDIDGVQDVLLTISIPETVDPNIAIQNYGLNTLILKGLDDGTYELAAENRAANYFSSYDCSAVTTAGTGWFKLTRARGTAGGYEYNYLFRYDKEKADWFYQEYYSNNGGFVEYGRAVIQTEENFGEITFQDFDELPLGDAGTENENTLDSLSVDTGGFVVSVSPCYVRLQDKETERKVNQLIADDITYFIENLRELQINVDINLFGSTTFVSPEVISIEYNIFGTINGDELNYSGINRKYFTTIIDMNHVKRMTLSELIDTEKLAQMIAESGFSDVWLDDSSAARAAYESLSEAERLQLLVSSDRLDAIFGAKNSGIFCALHEKSICLYVQPEFFGLGPESEEPKLYIPIETLLPYVTVPYWNTPSEAATHIQWQG